MGKPVLDTVKGESPLFVAGSAAEPFTYTPAKKVRALLIGVEAWGANVTPISAMTVNGAATTEEESRIGASPFPYAELRFIELGEEQSGPFTISPTKNKNANVRCEVIGIRSGSKVEVLEAKGSSGTGTSRFVGSQAWPAGGALGVFVITLGPALPTSRSGTLFLQRDEGESSWDVQTNERESTSANESWSWSGSVPAAAVGVLFTGEPPVEATAPENTAAPVVTGTTKVGETLSTTNGSWTGEPTSYTYQWERASNSGFNEGVEAISGATSATYQLVSADSEKYIRCSVVAKNGTGSSEAKSSARVGPVEAVSVAVHLLGLLGAGA